MASLVLTVYTLLIDSKKVIGPVIWTDYVLQFRLLILVLILFMLLYMGSKLRSTTKTPAYVTLIISFAVLIIGQSIQIYNGLGGDLTIRSINSIIFTLGVMCMAVSILFIVYFSERRLRGSLQLVDREKWLQNIYDNIPSALFVVKNKRIVYCNAEFQLLQELYLQENPFLSLLQNKQSQDELSQVKQELTLTTPGGQHKFYWIMQFPLPLEEGYAFIVTDISKVKLQSHFIEQFSEDLNQLSDHSFNIIFDTIAQSLPNSFVYVGRFDEESKSYFHMAHRGEDKGINIFSNLKLNKPLWSDENKWHWQDNLKIDSQEHYGFVAQYPCEKIGAIGLVSEQGETLGVILVLQKKSHKVNQLSSHLLSMFSARVRLDLEKIQNKKLISQSTSRYRAFITRSNEAIADIDVYPPIRIEDEIDSQWQQLKEVAVIKDFNPAFSQLFDIQGTLDIEQLLRVKSLKNILQYIFQSGYGSEAIEVAHKDQNGQIKWLSCSVMVDVEDGALSRIWLIIRDITDSKMHIKDLEYQTRHDALTGLPNRLSLRDTLDEKIEQALQFGFRVGLLLIDLDRFKEINDSLGHHYGDVLLKKIGPRIRPLLSRHRAFFARIGGDEFAILMPSLESLDEARELARDILDKLREPFDLGQLNVEISGSVGISVYPDNGKDTSTLLRCADVAMYKAKKQTGGILCYENTMDENSPRRLALMAAMGKGLKEKQYFLLYQPKLSLQDNGIYSAEALIRWQHPEMGLVSPGEFIPLAELSDIIIPMTEWVIETALAQIQNWMQQGVQIKVSVNVSTRNLLDENLLSFIAQKLKQYDVPPSLLELEITEGSLMVDPDRALDTLNKISQLGVDISVDDFGTGYSSMVYLRQLPINTLKVDIMFVRNMCNNSQDEIIVNSIIQLAKNLSLVVVAEGAEDKETLDRLKEMQCDQVQGYYVSKPISSDEFLEFREKWMHT